eukprot:scaffold4406_cov112-Isochrysis_galbana.AAC.20
MELQNGSAAASGASVAETAVPSAACASVDSAASVGGGGAGFGARMSGGSGASGKVAASPVGRGAPDSYAAPLRIGRKSSGSASTSPRLVAARHAQCKCAEVVKWFERQRCHRRRPGCIRTPFRRRRQGEGEGFDGCDRKGGAIREAGAVGSPPAARRLARPLRHQLRRVAQRAAPLLERRLERAQPIGRPRPQERGAHALLQEAERGFAQSLCCLHLRERLVRQAGACSLANLGLGAAAGSVAPRAPRRRVEGVPRSERSRHRVGLARRGALGDEALGRLCLFKLLQLDHLLGKEGGLELSRALGALQREVELVRRRRSVGRRT